MQIFWHGLSSVRIESQHGDQQATLITDPFEVETGIKFPRSLSPDIVALSHQQKDRFPLNVFETKPFVMADPGEFEVNGVFAYVIPLQDKDHAWPHTLMYRFEIEGMSVGFLGGADRALTDEELGKLEDIDILLLPVGGDDRMGEFLHQPRFADPRRAGDRDDTLFSLNDTRQRLLQLLQFLK